MPHSHDLEWQQVIGKAIVRFGDIEIVSIHCLSILTPELSQQEVIHLPFEKRTKMIIEALKTRLAKNEEKEHQGIQELLDGFSRASKLTHLRNLIAHNPVMLDVYLSLDEKDIHFEHSIRGIRRAGVVLTLDAATEFASEVEDLSATLWMAFLKHSNDSEALWKVHRE